MLTIPDVAADVIACFTFATFNYNGSVKKAKGNVIYFASLAFRQPRWYSVALFFCVLEISFSISAILSKIPIMRPGGGGASTIDRK